MSGTTIIPTPGRRAALEDDGGAEPTLVRSLSYSQLRLVCESAAGIPVLGTPDVPIEDVVFVSDTHGVRWTAAGDAVSGDVVRVPARIYGLVHIPRSLWVTPEEALQEAERQGLRQEELDALAAYHSGTRVHWASALREVGVVHGPAGARPRLLPLDEFRVLYPGRFA